MQTCKIYLEIVQGALSAGVKASYVLMDSSFTQQPLIQSLVVQRIDVIGMVKATNQRYTVDDKRVSLKELYRLATPTTGKKSILCSIHTTMANEVRVKVVFVRNRNKRSEWLAILSTDCSLTEQEIIRIYGMRRDIEVFFKTTKSLLKLQKEFQGISYDALISHTTIVFSRYILLSWQNRSSTDDRTLGGMFYEQSYTPHSFRHSIAVHMPGSRIPLSEIKNLLGHKSIETTMIYAIDSEDLMNRYLKKKSILNDMIPTKQSVPVTEKSGLEFLKIQKE